MANLSERRMTVCYCPRCEKEHMKYIFWTGHGTPRIFCDDCIELEDDELETFSISHEIMNEKLNTELYDTYTDQ